MKYVRIKAKNSEQYVYAPIATLLSPGIVQPDGTSLSIDENGLLSAREYKLSKRLRDGDGTNSLVGADAGGSASNLDVASVHKGPYGMTIGYDNYTGKNVRGINLGYLNSINDEDDLDGTTNTRATIGTGLLINKEGDSDGKIVLGEYNKPITGSVFEVGVGESNSYRRTAVSVDRTSGELDVYHGLKLVTNKESRDGIILTASKDDSTTSYSIELPKKDGTIALKSDLDKLEALIREGIDPEVIDSLNDVIEILGNNQDAEGLIKDVANKADKTDIPKMVRLI